MMANFQRKQHFGSVVIRWGAWKMNATILSNIHGRHTIPYNHLCALQCKIELQIPLKILMGFCKTMNMKTMYY